MSRFAQGCSEMDKGCVRPAERRKDKLSGLNREFASDEMVCDFCGKFVNCILFSIPINFRWDIFDKRNTSKNQT